MIKALKKLYHQQRFLPTWIGIFMNPFFIARRGLQRGIHTLASRLDGKLLDVGCGTKPYESLFKVDTYTGLDIDSETARAFECADDFYDGTRFPYEDASFDCVLCNQVLEHVFNPDEFLAEINRVLPIDGQLLLTIPFVWDEHEQPYDYARYSSFGLQALLNKSGFKVVEHIKIGDNASVIFQLINAYIYKVILNWPLCIKLFLTATLMAGVHILGLIVGWILPRNPDLFLDHAVLAKKTTCLPTKTNAS